MSHWVSVTLKVVPHKFRMRWSDYSYARVGGQGGTLGSRGGGKDCNSTFD